MRAPVAPIGCPRAIAPPFTLSRSGSKLQLAVAGQDLGREGLVDLDQVEVRAARSESRSSSRLTAGTTPMPITRRVDARPRPPPATRAMGLTPSAFARSRGQHHHRRRAVGDAGRVAGRDGARLRP